MLSNNKIIARWSRLKVALLLPLAASLMLFSAVQFFSFYHQEAEYTEEFVDQSFLSARHVFDSAVQTNSDKLSSTMAAISRDPVLIRAMLAGDRQALLQRSAPLLETLRTDYSITHFYFIRPDRSVFLRVHQPERHGDVLDRYTAKQAQASGKLASGLELGPAGTFTLRTVVPWREGNQLIGYIELGEEVGFLLDSVREMLGLDLFVTIQKRYLNYEDWARGMVMLNRQGEWASLPASVIIFQTMQKLPAAILRDLDKSDFSRLSSRYINVDELKYRTSQLPLLDAGGRVVGDMFFLRDITTHSAHSIRDLSLAAGALFILSIALFWFFYLIIGRIEKRIDASRAYIMESEARFRGLVESSSDWIWEIDGNNRYVYASPKIRDLLGYAPEEILGKTPFDLMPPDEANRIANLFAGFASHHQPFHALENINLHKDGYEVILETNGVPILGQNGTLLGYRGIDRDITERKHAEAILAQSSQRLNLLFQQTPLAVIEWNLDFRVQEWNPAAEKIFGYSKTEALGRHATELILPESAQQHVAEIWQSLLSLTGGERSTNENISKEGNTIYCEWYNTRLITPEGLLIGVASLVQDVTEQKLSTERITYLAYHDDLTGLPNRSLFVERLSQAFIEAERKQRLVSIMLLDIDNFQNINNTLGHLSGNALLQAVSRRLHDCLRPSDTVARFGGDEFAVLLTDMGHIDDAVNVAQHVFDVFKEPFFIHGQKLFVTFSMGITLHPLDDIDIENLLRNADSAMYAAKASGRNCFRFYASSMTARAKQHLSVTNGLRHALDNQHFVLHYQPQLDLSSHRITGVEALVRWQHHETGMIPPADFIPIAEETGLIIPLGEWVLREACLQVLKWQTQGLPFVRMAVNLSARQFKEPNFAKRVLEIIHETGMNPDHLELEVTESILVDGIESVSETLNIFRQAGIMISLDDFGTGYSSLSYLKRFPIDKLKIDQSFVRDILTDHNDASLVRAIIAMAVALQMKVIAEGVETVEQFDFLQSDGCDEIQGYYIARPLSAEQFAEFVLHYNKT